MKIGMRKPSIKKSVKARTTGNIKRKFKKSINPLYGKKGMGWVRNPHKALYNKIYHKTTFGVKDIISSKNTKNKNFPKKRKNTVEQINNFQKNINEKQLNKSLKITKFGLLPISIFLVLLSLFVEDWIFLSIGIAFTIISIYSIHHYKNIIKSRK